MTVELSLEDIVAIRMALVSHAIALLAKKKEPIVEPLTEVLFCNAIEHNKRLVKHFSIIITKLEANKEEARK